MELIGRKKNVRELDMFMHSGRPEFIALYGRRRVGKTYLVENYFNHDFAFSATGIIGGGKADELDAFNKALIRYGYSGEKTTSWNDAFYALENLLESRGESKGRTVVFLDELPCFETHKSGFVMALDHFWNGWASKRDDIFLVVCGSATSWIVRNIIDNHGGLHNRITHEIHLYPFTLADTTEYMKAAGCLWDDISIIQTYMILGGIPYYLSLLWPQDSLSQNIDRLFFSRDAELKKEYKRLYKSLFKSPEKYIDAVKILSEVRGGLTKNEIAKKLSVSNNGHLSDLLDDLENCDFIRRYNVKQKKISAQGSIYQLTDMYTIFYHEFVKTGTTDEQYWSRFIGTQMQSTWWGLAFERLCQAHIPQILNALGVRAVHTEYYAWRAKADGDNSGCQIDLIIERADRMINVCEIKYCGDSLYELDYDERMKIAERNAAFRRETDTKYGILPTLITTYGLKEGKNASYFNGVVVTMEDLMKEV